MTDDPTPAGGDPAALAPLPPPDPAVQARARGCLLGQLCGDALGSMVEFRAAGSIAADYPNGLRRMAPSPQWRTLAGQPTDDSEMALVLARTLTRSGFDPALVANAYVDWFESRPFDYGDTISRAVGAMTRARTMGADPVAAAQGAANRESAANGALMRESPLAIWGWALPPEALAAQAAADAALTHPNPVAVEASAAYLVACAAAIREGLDGAETHARAVAWQQAHGQAPSVLRALEAASRETPADFLSHQGWVLLALQNAFYQALHAPSLEDGVVDTVMRGGDTDTNGAIAGALLGAIHGEAAIPRQWRDAVLGCRPERGHPGVQRPRPPELWPCDALELADALLAAGPRPLPPSS